MHCLLCREKIPRLRYWRTKSEFCCDEHAAQHRRQTLERLVGRTSGPDEMPVDRQALLASLTGGDIPPAPAALLDTQPQGNASQDSAAQDTRQESAGALTLFDPAAENARSRDESLAAREVETSAGYDESEERHFVTEEAELSSEEAEDTEQDLEEEEDGYFEGTSVQRDEPFPVEIAAAESDDAEELDSEPAGPLEPSAFDDADSADLADLLAVEDATGSEAEVEASLPIEPALTAAESEELQASGEAGAEASGETKLKASDEEGALGLELDLGSELAAETALDASEPKLKQQQPDSSDAARSQSEPTSPAVEAAAVSRKAARKMGRGGLQPVKAWDPTRARRKKGRAGDESLNRLAGQLSDRDLKLRAMGPGSELRREGKSKLVCFLPVQGGNGSSTVSLHVAEAISHHLSKRVLLADFDFHSGTLAFRLGLRPSHTFVDVFQWEQPEDELWSKVVCPWKQLDVLVAPPSNSSIHPQSLDRLPDIFMSALQRYPYVIVDHPDAIYSSSRHILAMSDLVYLVCTPEITSLHLARRKVQQIRAMGVPGERLRLIVNRTGSWGSLGLEDVGKIAGVPVSWALMNDYAALRDAVWNGGLVQDGSVLAKQLRELGWSIMGVDAPVAEQDTAPTEAASHT